MDSFTFFPEKIPITGMIKVPGDKSISHRALIFGSLVKNPVAIFNLNQGEDVFHTRKALEKLGVNITDIEKEAVRVEHVGDFIQPPTPLYLGNSGTSARLLMGLLASCDFKVHLTGDASLQKRPMKRAIDPLFLMGASFKDTDGCLPITVTGNKSLSAISYRLPVPSAQLKSALMIAALKAKGITRIIEPVLSRDHTERLMKFLDMPIKISYEQQERIIEVVGDYSPKQKREVILNVPGDPSAAAFWIVASLLIPDSCLRINAVCWNSFRNAFAGVLKRMGAKIQATVTKHQMGEECVDIISQTSSLQGIEIPADLAPSLIDEYPILAVAAAFAEGKSVFRGLQELRFKESNRLQTIEDNLKACGVRCYIQNNDLFIEGKNFNPIEKAIEINPQYDHRIVMAFSIFALAQTHPITIHQTNAVMSSYPGFFGILRRFLNFNSSH